MTEDIYFYLKDDEYGWMSNFYPSPICDDNEVFYPTVEHFYQAYKTGDPAVATWIASAPKPYLAMKAGRNLREKDGFYPQWEDIKRTVMVNGLRLKFQIPELREKLLATGNARLHESSPTDKYWGVKGEDQLGKCLMQVRDEIRAGREEKEYVQVIPSGIIRETAWYSIVESEWGRGVDIHGTELDEKLIEVYLKKLGRVVRIWNTGSLVADDYECEQCDEENKKGEDEQ